MRSSWSPIVDAGYLNENGENSVNIENRKLAILENFEPGLIALTWDWLKNNLPVRLGAVIGILTLISVYQGVRKVRVERDANHLAP